MRENDTKKPSGIESTESLSRVLPFPARDKELARREAAAREEVEKNMPGIALACMVILVLEGAERAQAVMQKRVKKIRRKYGFED